MNTTHRNAKDTRVTRALSLMQEEALVGLMYEEFGGRNNYKSLDYDKIRRFATSIQTDPVVCESLEAMLVTEDEAWEPDDDWITNMCHAFIDARDQEARKTKNRAFGGPRVEYDPKNPHRKASGGTQRGSPGTNRASPSSRLSPEARMAAKAIRLVAARGGLSGSGSGNPFDTRMSILS